MELILQLLNEMEAQGLIQRYAIGGGMAVMFYVQPILTEDIDVFVLLPPTGSPIIVLTPLYDFFGSEAFSARALLRRSGRLVRSISTR